MEKKRFKKGDKVFWNAGWNSNPHWKGPGDKESGRIPSPCGWMIRGPYDFGYYSQSDGLVILYEEGESSMQDSFAVSENYVIAEKDYKQAKMGWCNGEV